mgnify:CR=1 FL=1
MCISIRHFRPHTGKFLAIGFILALFSGMNSQKVQAQQIDQKIPRDANTIVVLNFSEIVAHADGVILNRFLGRTGFFKQFEKKNIDLQQDLYQSGIDLNGKAFYYRINKDSLRYAELVIPIQDIQRYTSLLNLKGTSLPSLNGYERFRMESGNLLAWNAKEFRILMGATGATYFSTDSIAALYGIEPVDYASGTMAATSIAAEAAAEAATYPRADTFPMDSTEVSWEATDFDRVHGEELEIGEDAPVSVDSNWGDMDMMGVDDINYDSLYTAYEEANKRNDSIKNALLDRWLLQEQEHLLNGTYPVISKEEQQRLLNKVDLLRIWIPRVDGFYRGLNSVRSIVDAYFSAEQFSLDSEYKDLFVDLSQQQNKLRLKTSVSLGKDMAALTKKLYARKPNPKFAKYLTDETIGYVNVNLNTEAYLNEMPTFFSKNLGKFFGHEEELLQLFATGFEIVIDEKAIADIMPGDHLIIVNGITHLKVDYTDYDYDDNYELKEVHKTKEEKVPSFVWMFTSKDQRMIKKTLDFAVSKSKAHLADGIYRIVQNNGKDFPLYVLFHEDLIMLSNDSTQLPKILQHKKRGYKPNKAFIKLMKNNKLSASFQVSRIPALVKDLNIVLDKNWQDILDELNNYGNFTLNSKGIVGNRLETDLQLHLPSAEKNALQFILNQLMDRLAADEQLEFDHSIDVTEND